MNADDYADVVLVISLVWALFVFLFMVSVWGDLSALRKRLAPEPPPILWDQVSEHYGVGVSLSQPMYGIYMRGAGALPIEVFPFTLDGRDAARIRRITRDAMEACRGLHVDVTLKDVDTVQKDPRRLAEWTRITREVVEDYA